jgi:hypothetical protein
MMKLDIADAFMCVPLLLASILKLVALLPQYLGEPQLEAFLLVLLIGLVNSLAWICTVSETLTDCEWRKGHREQSEGFKAAKRYWGTSKHSGRGRIEWPWSP